MALSMLIACPRETSDRRLPTTRRRSQEFPALHGQRMGDRGHRDDSKLGCPKTLGLISFKWQPTGVIEHSFEVCVCVGLLLVPFPVVTNPSCVLMSVIKA